MRLVPEMDFLQIRDSPEVAQGQAVTFPVTLVTIAKRLACRKPTDSA